MFQNVKIFQKNTKKNVQDIAHQILPQIFSQIFQLPFREENYIADTIFTD